MSRVIWKFPLEVTDMQPLALPSPNGAPPQFLCVQTQNGVPCLWAEVDPVATNRTYTIHTLGTGEPVGGDRSNHRYIGTYQLRSGTLVFHVYVDTLGR